MSQHAAQSACYCFISPMENGFIVPSFMAQYKEWDLCNYDLERLDKNVIFSFTKWE